MHGPVRTDGGCLLLEFSSSDDAVAAMRIAAFVILQLLLVLGPLCVFAPMLLALKRRGRREYGALGARYTR